MNLQASGHATLASDRPWADRLRLRASFPRRHVLIVPPGPQGGVGDEAATQMLARCAHDLGATRVGVVIYGPDDDWGLRSAVPPVELVQVPSWPFDRACWSVREVTAAFRTFDHVLVAGADCIDGGYSEEGTLALLDLGRFADEHGCRVAFVNCSFNARPTAGVLRALAAMPDRIPFWLRDDVSGASFRRSTGRIARAGAEIAFLIEPEPAVDSAVLEWVRRERSLGNRIVVLVPNPLVGTPEPLLSPQRSPVPYLEILAAACRNDDVRFVVLPNDARSAVGDVELAAAIAAGLPADMRSRVFFVPQPIPAPILADFFRHVDVLVGARFHALVIALSAGTPVVGLEYQGKVRGVLRMCGLEEFSIPAEDGLSPATIVARLDEALRRIDELRATVARALPVLRRRARNMLIGALAGGG